MIARGATLFAVLVALVSCANEAANRGGAIERLEVDSVPIIDISDTLATGGNPIGNVVGAAVLASVMIAIADGYASHVQFYGAGGELVRTVGRRGNGPGEFQAISWLSQCGADSVFVWDYMARTMTVMDESGNIVRRYTLPFDPGALSCSAHGRFIALVPPYTAPEGVQFPHERAHLQLMNDLGDSVQALGVVPAWEQRVLGKVTQLAIGGGRIFVGTADSSAVDVLSLDGEKLSTIEVDADAPRRPTAVNYDAALERMLARVNEPQRRPAWRKLARKTMPPPEFLPPYSGLLLDRAGVLWIDLSAPGDDSTRLRGIDPTGSIVGDAVIHGDVRVFEVGNDYVLGMQEDDQGFQHVTMYRFHRDGS